MGADLCAQQMRLPTLSFRAWLLLTTRGVSGARLQRRPGNVTMEFINLLSTPNTSPFSSIGIYPFGGARAARKHVQRSLPESMTGGCHLQAGIPSTPLSYLLYRTQLNILAIGRADTCPYSDRLAGGRVCALCTKRKCNRKCQHSHGLRRKQSNRKEKWFFFSSHFGAEPTTTHRQFSTARGQWIEMGRQTGHDENYDWLHGPCITSIRIKLNKFLFTFRFIEIVCCVCSVSFGRATEINSFPFIFGWMLTDAHFNRVVSSLDRIAWLTRFPQIFPFPNSCDSLGFPPLRRQRIGLEKVTRGWNGGQGIAYPTSSYSPFAICHIIHFGKAKKRFNTNSPINIWGECSCVVDAANKRPDPSTRTAFNLKIQKTFHTFHTDTPDLCLSEWGDGDGGLWGVKQIRRKRKMRTRILTRHRGTHAHPISQYLFYPSIRLCAFLRLSCHLLYGCACSAWLDRSLRWTFFWIINSILGCDIVCERLVVLLPVHLPTSRWAFTLKYELAIFIFVARVALVVRTSPREHFHHKQYGKVSIGSFGLAPTSISTLGPSKWQGRFNEFIHIDSMTSYSTQPIHWDENSII